MSVALLLGAAAGGCIGGVAAYLGTLMLGRRMALAAGPLGHLALPGMVLAVRAGVDVSLGAFPLVVLGAVTIWWLERRTRLPMEALTALVFATGVALAALLVPMAQAGGALVGDLTQMSPGTAGLSVAGALGIGAAVRRYFARLVLVSISDDLAVAEGLPVRRLQLLYLLLVAVVVALGVRLVGGLLTAALAAIPPMTARNLSGSLRQLTLRSVAIGAGGTAVGILLAGMQGLPAGPVVVLVSAAGFLASLAMARAPRPPG
jgi:zinc transport system permease protein